MRKALRQTESDPPPASELSCATHCWGEEEEEEETPYVDRQTAQAEENRCQVATNLNFYQGAKNKPQNSWAIRQL